MVEQLQTFQASNRSEKRKKITEKIYQAYFPSNVIIYIFRLGTVSAYDYKI